MMEKEKNVGVTFNGSVTFNGPMFDIHDNQQVTIVNKEAGRVTLPNQQPHSLNQQELMEYVMRIMPLVAEGIRDGYTKVWRLLLRDEAVSDYLLHTKDSDFKSFNKYKIHGILGVMKEKGVFKPKTTDIKIAMLLEKTNNDTKYRSYISSGVSDSQIKKP